MKKIAAFSAALMLIPAACGRGTRTEVSPSSKELNVQVASFDMAVGEQRFLVGLLLTDIRFVSYGQVQLDFAFIGTRNDARLPQHRTSTKGSFIAVPLEAGEAPAPKEGPSAGPASHGRGVYGAPVSFDQPGFWQVSVTAEVEGEGVLKGSAPFEVLANHLIPAPGEPAPRTENLTIHSEAPRAAIDSRGGEGDIPDPELHEVTIAHAIDTGRPAIVVFSTPVFCQSRFCGPVTDMIAGMASQYSDRAWFIHVEVWRDFDNQEINKAAVDWLYREGNLTEPWVFFIGADGRISARWDNVVARSEIEPILQQLPGTPER